jgi:hypothetical protein
MSPAVRVKGHSAEAPEWPFDSDQSNKTRPWRSGGARVLLAGWVRGWGLGGTPPGTFQRQQPRSSSVPLPSRNFIVAIADLLLPGVGTLGKGSRGAAIAVLRPFAL